MTRPSFWQGVVVAAVLAGLSSTLVAALIPFVGAGTVFRWVIPLLGFGYVAYLLSRSGHNVGRTTILIAWCAISIAVAWLAPSLSLYLLMHVAMIWLIRSLYFYSGILPAVMDLGLSLFSVSAMVWAVTRSGSILLATWCFFLTQALFAAIPERLGRKHDRIDPANPDNFQRARRQADDALRQLFTHNSRTH
ncbi:MAG: hypothetical protein AAFN07_08510 [Pseudomonadota bacterium]